jgi:hypothetical protein
VTQRKVIRRHQRAELDVDILAQKTILSHSIPFVPDIIENIFPPDQERVC